MHEGIDLKTYKGNPVLATADGIVEEAGTISTFAWGKIIRIKHEEIYETVYAHLSSVQVKKGDKVKRGDIIGNAGSTGESTGPHLHYEVKDGKKNFLDPVDFIDNYDFKKGLDAEKTENPTLGKPDQKLKIVIDAGHGGEDFGIQSSKMSEKEITLKVAQLVSDNFNDSDDVEIILTRSQDESITLKDRVIKSEGADLFISLHIETHEDDNEDMMVAIYSDQNENAKASQYFGELLSVEFEEINRDFKVGYTDGYYVLQNAKSPAILFYMGYFSNPESKKYLNSEDGIAQIANELSDAIKASK
jgi:N-acetylmuramoyl-L-alanine amidase